MGLAFVLLSLAGAARADDLRIAAAANLQKVMSSAIIPAFQKQTGATVTPTFGSTRLLAAQVQNGAPIDVFVAADTETTAKLASQGTVISDTVRVYAIGKLVIWTRKDAAKHPSRLQDLRDPAYVHIAIANPALAPYGRAATQSLANVGLTAIVAPRLVQADNISAALQYAQSGNADAALTALSLVIDDHTDPYVIVPDYLHAPIAQSAAVVTAAKNGALARLFVSFLVSPQAAPLWKRYGYSLPPRRP